MIVSSRDSHSLRQQWMTVRRARRRVTVARRSDTSLPGLDSSLRGFARITDKYSREEFNCKYVVKNVLPVCRGIPVYFRLARLCTRTATGSSRARELKAERQKLSAAEKFSRIDGEKIFPQGDFN